MNTEIPADLLELMPSAPYKTYPQVIIELILAELEGGKKISSVLDGSNPMYPAKSTWFKWCSEDSTLDMRYVRASQKGIAARHGID
ncbi:hypothetical protein [Paraburkholderia sp. C35]|uniref:hypothetical protein n=1 Tax=Paraburkholderia sp. C35 TaxID=2126993 RepID=UPI000D687370|nr:hypothetical protein [Paraburkholderia sp. C35]